MASLLSFLGLPEPDPFSYRMHHPWSIWHERNKSYFSQTQPNLNNVLERAKNHLTLFHPLPYPSTDIENNLSWQKPNRGKLKLNFDATWCSVSKQGFLGWLFRDDDGTFIAGVAKGGECYNLAKEAEAVAAREGLMFANNNGLKDFVCEGDAKLVIEQNN